MIGKQEREILKDFYEKIHFATVRKQEWIETSDEIIQHFVPDGLGKSGYFIYQGIKVAPYGKSAQLNEDLSRQLGQVVYGPSEAKSNHGTETGRSALAPVR